MMAHQMTIVLTDEEYANLLDRATQSGKPVESLARDLLSRSLSTPPSASQPQSVSQFTQQQYLDGKLLNMPTGVPLIAEELANRERRAQLLSGGKSASEMVSEDRGPR